MYVYKTTSRLTSKKIINKTAYIYMYLSDDILPLKNSPLTFSYNSESLAALNK